VNTLFFFIILKLVKIKQSPNLFEDYLSNHLRG
jgi:hypothetical protein